MGMAATRSHFLRHAGCRAKDPGVPSVPLAAQWDSPTTQPLQPSLPCAASLPSHGISNDDHASGRCQRRALPSLNKRAPRLRLVLIAAFAASAVATATSTSALAIISNGLPLLFTQPCASTQPCAPRLTEPPAKAHSVTSTTHPLLLHIDESQEDACACAQGPTEHMHTHSYMCTIHLLRQTPCAGTSASRARHLRIGLRPCAARSAACPRTGPSTNHRGSCYPCPAGSASSR